MVRVYIFDIQVYIYKREDMVYIRIITIVLLLYVVARFFFTRVEHFQEVLQLWFAKDLSSFYLFYDVVIEARS